jgi:hypothetical protein
VICVDLVSLMLVRYFLTNFLIGQDGLVVFERQLLDHNGSQE